MLFHVRIAPPCRGDHMGCGLPFPPHLPPHTLPLGLAPRGPAPDNTNVIRARGRLRGPGARRPLGHRAGPGPEAPGAPRGAGPGGPWGTARGRARRPLGHRAGPGPEAPGAPRGAGPGGPWGTARGRARRPLGHRAGPGPEAPGAPRGAGPGGPWGTARGRARRPLGHRRRGLAPDNTNVIRADGAGARVTTPTRVRIAPPPAAPSLMSIHVRIAPACLGPERDGAARDRRRRANGAAGPTGPPSGYCFICPPPPATLYERGRRPEPDTGAECGRCRRRPPVRTLRGRHPRHTP